MALMLGLLVFLCTYYFLLSSSLFTIFKHQKRARDFLLSSLFFLVYSVFGFSFLISMLCSPLGSCFCSGFMGFGLGFGEKRGNCYLVTSTRHSPTTVSTCFVIGNISTGCTSTVLYPCSSKYFKSLARVLGSHDT